MNLDSSPIIIGESPVSQTVSRNQLQVMNYFPSLVYSAMLPEFLDISRSAAKKALAAWKKSNPPLDPMYPVVQTENLFSYPELEQLVSYIGSAGASILDSQGHNMSNLSVYFSEMWCQEHHRHSAMDQHVHGIGAQLVGFYFLDVPKDSSRIVIHDPRPGRVQINLPEKNISDVTQASVAVNFSPQAGQLFIANSWLPHSFTRNASLSPLRFIHFTLGVRDLPPATAGSFPPPAPDLPVIV